MLNILETVVYMITTKY